jgi:hypothetical protein
VKNLNVEFAAQGSLLYASTELELLVVIRTNLLKGIILFLFFTVTVTSD